MENRDTPSSGEAGSCSPEVRALCLQIRVPRYLFIFFARQIIPFMTMPSAVVRRDLTGSLGRGLDREKRLEREDTANWCGRR